MSDDILSKLVDLHKQATEERSHYYTGLVIREAIAEISRQNARILHLEAVIREMVRRSPDNPEVEDAALDMFNTGTGFGA